MEPGHDFALWNQPVGIEGDGTSRLAVEAQWWARERNVEAVWCWLPTFDQVCDGTHTITALGNDGMAVNIIVDNEQAARTAGIGGEQVQLAFLGRILVHMRREEIMQA